MYHVEWITRWLENINGLENPKQYVIEEKLLQLEKLRYFLLGARVHRGGHKPTRSVHSE